MRLWAACFRHPVSPIELGDRVAEHSDLQPFGCIDGFVRRLSSGLVAKTALHSDASWSYRLRLAFAQATKIDGSQRTLIANYPICRNVSRLKNSFVSGRRHPQDYQSNLFVFHQLESGNARPSNRRQKNMLKLGNEFFVATLMGTVLLN